MAKTAFSDVFIRSLQPPAKGQKSYWDEKLPCFGLRVSQGGSKTFVLNRDNSLLTIGRFGVLSLAEARTEAKRLMAERTLGRVRPQSLTFLEALTLFLEDKAGRRARTLADHRRHLSLLGFKCQLADITHADLERKLKPLPPSEYNHRLACAKTFFGWAHRKRYINDNPTTGFSMRSRASRARILSDEELKAVWTAADQLGQFGAIVKLLLLCGLRRNEAASIQVSWVNEQEKTLTVPASIAKNGREFTFPLGNLAMDILSPLLTAESLLFPARGRSSPFAGWSKASAELWRASGVCGATLHDIRRTYATNMARLGVPIHVVERLLNHFSGTFSGVVGIYQRHEYWREQVEAIERYEQFLLGLLHGQEAHEDSPRFR
jgi:integrase